MCVLGVVPLSPPSAMSLDGLQASSNQAVTQLGSMLFTRQVSGARYENWFVTPLSICFTFVFLALESCMVTNWEKTGGGSEKEEVVEVFNTEV